MFDKKNPNQVKNINLNRDDFFEFFNIFIKDPFLIFKPDLEIVRASPDTQQYRACKE
jgi:hypothetical protein